MASTVVGLLRVLLSAETAEFDSAMKRSADSAKAWTRDLKSIGQQATNIGSTLTKAFTLPIAGVGVAVSKLAIDFESSFAGVRKTVDATESEFATMAQSFRDLAKEIPVSVNELNRLGEAAGALGIPKAEIVDFARVMAMLGVTTNITSDQAAESIAKIQNIFGAAGKDTDRFAATLVALGNDGASTESQIVEMASRIAGAGNAINITQGEVLAFASALSSVGIEAEMGGSAISRVFIEMASAVSQGGEAVEGFARVANMSISEFSRLFKEDAASAVNAFIAGLGRVKQSGGDLIATIEELGFKEIRVRDTLLRTAGAGDLLTRALQLQKTAWQENTALTEEARKRFETTASQLTLLWNRVKDVGITLGNALLPAIKLTTNALTLALPLVEALAKGFAILPAPLQLIAIGMAALVAAAGPALYLFGQLALSASALTGAFTAKGIATRVLAGNLGVLRGAYAVLLAPITLSTASTAAGTVAMAAKSVAARGLTVSLGAMRVAVSALLGPIGLVTAAVGAATLAFVSWKQAQADARIVAETSSAKQDAINLAISRGAEHLKVITDRQKAYTLAIQFNQEWNQKRLQGLEEATRQTQRTSGATKSLTDSLDDLNAKTVAADKEIADLSKTAKSKLAEAIRSGAFSMDELKKATGLSELALKRFEASLKSSEKTAVKAGKAIAKSMDEAAKEAVDLFRESKEAAFELDLMFARLMKSKADARDILGLKQSTEEAVASIRRTLGAVEPEAVRLQSRLVSLQKDSLAKRIDLINLEYTAQVASLDETSEYYTEHLDILGRERDRHIQEATEEWQSLGDQIRTGLASAFASIAQVTDGWVSSLLDGLSRAMVALGNFGNLAKATATQKIATIGAGISDVLAATGQGSTTARVVGGAATGAVAGAATSAALGAKLGSAGGIAGIAIGAGVGALVGWLRARSARKKEEKEANEALKEMKKELLGVFGSFQEIEDIGKAIGVNLTGMWDATGPQGLERFSDAAQEFQDRINGLNEELLGIAERGGVASKELITFRDAMRDSAEMADFLKRESAAAAQGVTDFLAATTIQTQAGAAALGGVIAGAFAELQTQGMSAREALAALQPAISALNAQLQQTGFDGGQAFGYIQHLAAIAANEISGPALDAVNGLTRALQGAHNAGFLTQDMFSGLVGEILAQREAILGTGVAAETVNSLMQRDLQTIWQLQNDFNYQVDEATQMLLDEAEAAGTVGDQYRSAMDRAARAMERVANHLEIILEKAGILGETLHKIPRAIDIDVNYHEGEKPSFQDAMQDRQDSHPQEPQMIERGGMVQPQYRTLGGVMSSLVNWKPRGTDTVAAMLTPNEGVVNLRGMSLLGKEGLDALNAGINPFAVTQQQLAMLDRGEPRNTGTTASGDQSSVHVHQHDITLEIDKRVLAHVQMTDLRRGEARTEFGDLVVSVLKERALL